MSKMGGDGVAGHRASRPIAAAALLGPLSEPRRARTDWAHRQSPRLGGPAASDAGARAPRRVPSHGQISRLDHAGQRRAHARARPSRRCTGASILPAPTLMMTGLITIKRLCELRLHFPARLQPHLGAGVYRAHGDRPLAAWKYERDPKHFERR
jgi:hypothetical protein